MTARRTLLVVEDDADIRGLLVDRLRGLGHEVVAVRSGEEALRAQAEHPVDLVLLDLVLPGIDGAEVVRRWRADGKDVPIVLVTVHDVPDGLADLPVLTKPFRVGQVVRMMDRVLGKAPGGDEPVKAPAGT